MKRRNDMNYPHLIETTMRGYTHVTTDMQKSASAIVGSFMDEIMLSGDE